MQQLNPQDAQFLYMESDDNLTHVTSISILDPTTVPDGKPVRFKEILAHVESRVHMSPVFRRKLVRVPLELDFPYWVDDHNFELEYHVTHSRLPKPGDWRQFCILMARYHSRPLDMQRPLWEMFVVEGLDNIGWLPKGSFAIATKIHHAAVDGTSIMQFFSALADSDNQGTPAVPLNTAKLNRAPQPSLLDMAYRAAWHNIRSPISLIDGVMRAAPGLYRMAENALRSQRKEKQPVPETRFNCPASPHKMFDATAFSLDDLKAVRKAVPGSTINDVVIAICSGALRKYLLHHDELADESLIAWVPINARVGGTADRDRPGNNITSMTTPIYTNVDDPIERLQNIRRSTQRSKEAKSGVSARLMTDLSKHVPAATQVMAGRLVLRAGLAARMCNLFISNVPGPQVPLYMNGAKQVATYGLPPLAEGMGLFIATPSYDGRMTFGVTSTREAMPDIRFFVECIEKSMAELQRAAKPLPQRKRASAATVE